jgi:CRISPR-associated protein Cas1
MTTLYLTEPYSTVRKDGDTLVVKIPANKELGTASRDVRVPLIKIEQVVVLADSTVTTPALLALLAQKADVCFCAYNGQFAGRLTPEFSRNGLLRIEQHKAHNDYARRLALAQQFVAAKLANQRTQLLRANRKLEDPAIAAAAEQLAGVMRSVKTLVVPATVIVDPVRPQADTPLGTLQGLEGAGAASYFGAFPKLLRATFGFDGRHKRPPTDPVNAMLSFGYVLLMNNVLSAIGLVGLDPYVGYLHSSQYGKPALALDLMEEFRPIIVDSVVQTVINNRILDDGDFQAEMNAYRLTDAARRKFLLKFEERLEQTVQHPTFEYQATYRRCLELQVRLLAKTLTGEIAAYPPFVAR